MPELTRITGNVIANGTITNDDISPSAAIAASKIGAGALPAGVTSLATGSTTARALNDRFADVINVKDFGAIGDGIADDGPAIRAAFARANTLVNSTIYFPSGIYDVKTYSDGTSTFNGAGVKSIVAITNNTSVHKTIFWIGDEGTKIQSNLYPASTGVGANAGYFDWFVFGPKYSLRIQNIEFASLIELPNSRPITGVGNSALNVPFGPSNCIVMGQLQQQITKDVFLEISDCTFREFTKSIAPGFIIGNEQVGTVSVYNNKFISKWGTNSAGLGPNGFPCVDLNAQCEKEFFCFNDCVGGPDDFTPILGTSTPQNPNFYCKDGTTLSKAYRTVVQGNHIKNYAIETISVGISGIAGPSDYRSTQYVNVHHIVTENSINVSNPIGQNFWGGYGVANFGPRAIISNNYVNGAYAGIYCFNPQERTIISDNTIDAYYATNRSLDQTYGIYVNGGTGFTTPISISTINRTGILATVVTTSPHYFYTGQNIAIQGSSISAYNEGVGQNTFKTIKVINSTTFTFEIEGNPATPSTGGTANVASGFISINDNIVNFSNMNSDNNTWNGSIGGYSGPNNFSIGISLVFARNSTIKNNYLRCAYKQNTNNKSIAFNADNGAIIENNVVYDFDFMSLNYCFLSKNKFYSNTTRTSAIRYGGSNAQATQVICDEHEFWFTPTQAGWWQLESLVPLNNVGNAFIEINVPSDFDGAKYLLNDDIYSNAQLFNANKKYQYTQLEYIRSGGQNNGASYASPANFPGSPQPVNYVCCIKHTDMGDGLVSKIANYANIYSTGYGLSLAIWVRDISLKPRKIIIKSKSSYQGDIGQPWGVTGARFLGSTDGAAFSPANGLEPISDWDVVTLKNGFNVLCRNKTTDRLHGFGLPLLGSGVPNNNLAEFWGQEYIDINNAGKFYKARGSGGNYNDPLVWVAIN